MFTSSLPRTVKPRMSACTKWKFNFQSFEGYFQLLPELKRMIAFKQVNSDLSMFNRFILTLSSDKIRSKIATTPACCALFRCNVKFGPKHIS